MDNPETQAKNGNKTQNLEKQRKTIPTQHRKLK